MTINDLCIRQFVIADSEDVAALWQECNLVVSWNDPQKDIDRKMKVNPELFLVGTLNGEIIATVMVGYEGHRGWINYLAVSPQHRRKGFARMMMEEVEEKIRAIGSPKINLQIRTTNLEAIRFYESIGYKDDKVVSYGKRLVDDEQFES